MSVRSRHGWETSASRGARSVRWHRGPRSRSASGIPHCTGPAFKTAGRPVKLSGRPDRSSAGHVLPSRYHRRAVEDRGGEGPRASRQRCPRPGVRYDGQRSGARRSRADSARGAEGGRRRAMERCGARHATMRPPSSSSMRTSNPDRRAVVWGTAAVRGLMRIRPDRRRRLPLLDGVADALRTAAGRTSTGPPVVPVIP